MLYQSRWGGRELGLTRGPRPPVKARRALGVSAPVTPGQVHDCADALEPLASLTVSRVVRAVRGLLRAAVYFGIFADICARH